MSEEIQESTERCEHCDKPIHHRRLTLGFLVKDALNNVFNLDRGLFFTLWWLIKDPGKVIRSFVKDDRHRFMNPFRLLLVAATFAVIGEAISDTSELINVFEIKGSDEGSTMIVQEAIRQYLDIIILVSVPLIAVGSWLVLRKDKWNFAEHLVLNAYAYSALTIIGTAISILSAPFPDTVRFYIEGFAEIINLYLFYVYVSTFSYSIIKGILWSILAFIVSGIITVVVAMGLGFTLSLLF